VPWDLAFGDRLTGTFGPLLLALPLGLLALRRPAGRLCLAAAALLATPWFFDTGARFLMPSVAFAALALGMALPRPAAWAAVVIQAALCWPQVIDTWETRFAFRLHEFPLRAALRLTPEAEYISIREKRYTLAKLVEKLTPPNARILALDDVLKAYLDRDATVAWQSAEGGRMLDTLRMAALDQGDDRYEWKARWPAADVGALRLRLAAGGAAEWQIDEIRMFSGEDQVFNSPQWELWAWPNPWEVPLAFDGNPATRWRTWEPARAGMLVEADFDHLQRLSAVTLLSQHPPVGPIQVYGRETGGRWRLLANGPDAVLREPRDLRLDAARALRSAGFRWILAATGSHGNAPIGNVLAEQAPQWGMDMAGAVGRSILFHVR
jgi:hypothetical protein